MGTQRSTIQRVRFWDQEGAWGHGGEALDTDRTVSFKEITLWNFSNEVSRFGGSIFSSLKWEEEN